MLLCGGSVQCLEQWEIVLLVLKEDVIRWAFWNISNEPEPGQTGHVCRVYPLP